MASRTVTVAAAAAAAPAITGTSLTAGLAAEKEFTSTKGTFNYLDPKSYTGKAWTKVDQGGKSFTLESHEQDVRSVRGHESEFGVDVSGFGLFHEPQPVKDFDDDATVRGEYYKTVEEIIKKQTGAKKVVIFDHTIRKRDPGSPRQPVSQVHVDQTQKSAEARVYRHLPADEADDLIKHRFQIINLWRPIDHPASDFPLALIDYRTTSPGDFEPTDLLYPQRKDNDDNDDRGKESLPQRVDNKDRTGYEARGETFGVKFNPTHQFYYVKDMTPDEVLFIKCYDSRGHGIEGGDSSIARMTPHTAFADPQTPEDALPRQSIEVRTLVFY